MSTNQNNTVEELIQGVLNHGPDVLAHCLYSNSVEVEKYFNRILVEHLDYPVPKQSSNKENWFIPDSYKSMDIESWLLNLCKTPDEITRVKSELDLYKQNNMIPVLNAIKYIVDTLRQHKIVWGVGRGSSVASYVLYLIGVHKIDSIKYNIPIEEFFKGEKNG